MTDQGSARLRRWTLALGVSVVAMGIAGASPAAAQCAPDPTVPGGTTNCTGTDADGLVVTTSGSAVVVAPTATVLAGNAAAAVSVQANSVYLTVNGVVDGGNSAAGIGILAGPPYLGPCDPYAGASPGSCTPGTLVPLYPSASATVTVAQGATVSGTQAVLLSRDPANPYGSASVSLFNSGTLIGTSGQAITDTVGNGFAPSITVFNQSNGTIVGGISGSAGSLYNDGSIDSGTGSAFSTTWASANISNTGQITSTGTAATISGIGGLYVTNMAGAVIGGGTAAISSGGALNLTNTGTITGSVVSTAAAGQNSLVDTRGGIIDGDLRLGAGDDTLRAVFDTATGTLASVTGMVDGGAGTDTLAIGISADATIGGVPLPTNFELLGLDLSNNATVTLAPTFATTGGVGISGTGTVINEADLVTNGPAVMSTSYGYSPSFINNATITATLSGNQIAVATPTNVTNTGTITAIGGGGVRAYATLTNAAGATIIASGTAAELTYGTLDNRGVIQSSGGIGAAIYGVSYAQSSNTGTISGATTGVALASGRLTNSGTISGGTTGVTLGYSSTLVNLTGATVTGGTTAVANAGSAGRVLNAGTINGTVDFDPNGQYLSSADIFVDAGGVVNGAMLLGGGDDQLVVGLAGNPTRPLAGATGGVDAGAGYDTIRFLVGGDAATDLALTNGFEALAYELDNNASLTLTAPAPLTTTIGLTGNGTVTLNGAISAPVGQTVIDATITPTDVLTGSGTGPAVDLTIINNGSLAVSSATCYVYPGPAALRAGTADVVNNGSIAVTTVPGAYVGATGIAGGGTVTNAGTITLIGASTGISGATNVVNSGMISDSPGSGAAGLFGVSSLVNSGLIEVDGVAVTSFGYSSQSSIANSGSIVSRLDAAISLSNGASLVNEAEGTIRGQTTAVFLSGGTVINRGTIVGDVSGRGGFYYGGSTFIADGGTVTGDVVFDAGRDGFITIDGGTGVSGQISGGDGIDVFGQVITASAEVSLDLDSATISGFEDAFVQARGAGTVATVTAGAPFAGSLYVNGDGAVVNQATLTGDVLTGVPFGVSGSVFPFYDSGVASFTNAGAIGGSVQGSVTNFANSGSIGSETSGGVFLTNAGDLTFANTGEIGGGGSLSAGGAITVSNGGTITDQLYIAARQADSEVAGTATVVNSGSISGSGSALAVFVEPGTAGATVPIDNRGMLTGGGDYGSAAVQLGTFGLVSGATAFTVTNSGTIQATLSDDALENGATGAAGVAASGYSNGPTSLALRNDAAGVITGAGDGAAVATFDVALTIDNAGRIAPGTDADGTTGAAIFSGGTLAAVVANTGTIAGSVTLGSGADRVENRGTIAGAVTLGAGDDSFVQASNGVLGGIADGGDGIDSFTLDAVGTGRLSASQLTGFELLSQTGTGSVAYSGSFGVDSIALLGGTITVAAGQTLATTGPTTITGGDAGVAVANSGTIAGAITLGAGSDAVTNAGSIGGAVRLGAGNDSYTEVAGSSVAGAVDGGAGTDLYRVVLAGDRTGIGARTGFEQLAIGGAGTLTLALDQSFDSVALSGTGLVATLGGFTIGRADGSAAAESLTVDGDIAQVALGDGADTLSLGAAVAAGSYDGGAGADMLRFTAAGPVTLAGTATGFEAVSSTSGALTVTGTLGSANATASFGDGAQVLTLASGGTLAGTIDLGAGDDRFRLDAGGRLNGTVAGGAGTDTAVLDLTNALTISPAGLSGFEQLVGDGAGALTLAGGASRFDSVTLAGDLTIAADAALTTTQLAFGPADNRLAVLGGFAGSVAGSAGTDSIDVSGGSAAAPVAFGSLSGVEALRMSAGLATVSGNASLQTLALTGGRLIGLAGSTIAAPTITVGTGATFGSAGTVTGNVVVNGTLSPGASPGTMTVNGNVALNSGSVSVFEITPTVSDQLRVNGAVSIASGATLQLVAAQAVLPGQSLDLIVASGGISGSFTTVLKPASLFGFVVQDGNRLSLLGQFLSDAGFSPQAQGAVAYVNGLLTSGTASPALLAAVPRLVTATGATNAAAFALLTPEAYASARQITVEQGLELADIGRGDGFAARRDTPGLFAFGSSFADTRTLKGDADAAAEAEMDGYGFVGGIGWTSGVWSLGGFVGYSNTSQDLDALGARTTADGVIAGLHARWSAGPVGVKATIAYDGGRADTRRAVPGSTARASYDLHGWVADLSVDYAVPVGGDWTLRPSVGATAIRATRDGVAERGSDAFALAVAESEAHALFVDGKLTVAGRADAAARPFASLGVRYQLDGRTPSAVGGFGGGGLGLLASGTSRAPALATATLGGDLALSPQLSLFSTLHGEAGKDDRRASAQAGLRLVF